MLSPIYGEGLIPQPHDSARGKGRGGAHKKHRGVWRFLLWPKDPPVSDQDPQPGTGHQQGSGTEGWGPCVLGVLQGDNRDVAAARGGDVQGRDWGRATAAVLSGSSFPRNPLGALLGIPGNTVLGATALHQETARARREATASGGARDKVWGHAWGLGAGVGTPQMCGGTLSSPGNPSPQRLGDDGCPLGSQPPAREHWWWPFTLLLPFGALLEGWVSAGPHARHLAILAPVKVSASSDSPGRFFGTGSSAGHTALWCRTLAKGKMHPAGVGWRQRKGTDTAGSSRQPGQAGTAGGSAASATAGRAVLPSLPALQGPPFCPYPTQQQNHPHAAREAAGVPFPMPTGVTGSPWPPLPASPEMPASAAGRSSAPKPVTGVTPMSPSSPARCSASS